ncbi:efflux RND transporter periplasmic adaptor subunit [Sphingomonas sp. AP4-R1]|uniref:efflux RND transporter periplasmic adaptor subunit n=1 Tax=Sphingomonas sp. AP4-R1 TaxID=2735134 RepID=UPI0014938B3D|nr:efflux RND transporter periplasmic adaptor subunit [Sphingomonas sp. AP4-R1]QJU57499.1 efflux RND transporter periplasmic adaptor subunit [Sphingomonas sp. AP4-R1]
MEDQWEEPVARSPHSRRNAWIVVVVLVVIALLAWAFTRSGGQPSRSGAGAAGARGGAGGPGGPGGFGGGRRQAATVGTEKVTAADMPETIAAIGTVTPIVTATVRPQLSGNIFTIDFTEGQMVRKGQLLAQIDPRPYRLALSQAQANLERDLAQLNLAQVTLKRYQTLLSQDSIARQEVDTQAASLKQYEGTVAADRAAIGTAKLNLQYTSITAPVSGRIGLRQADIGNYVTPGDTAGIAVITQTTPIDVAFALPQDDLQTLLTRRTGGRALPVTAKDQGGTTVLAEGSFLTFDNQIDATTGTVRAKARFANTDGKLFPNQFVNVVLVSDTLKGVATVPVSAVRHGAQGDFVFTLQEDKTAKLALVKTGPSAGTRIAVLSGVKIGETVITEGADNLDDGSPVILPGDARPDFSRNRKSGWFSWLFGGSSAKGGADGAPSAAGAQGNASGEGGERRHRRTESAGQ